MRRHQFKPEPAEVRDRDYLCISICICTRNRPKELTQALKSLAFSTHPIHQVIVSDDSTDTRTKDMVTTLFPEVVYLSGPRMGLSANRNHALTKVTASHVLFMDDDVLFNPNFIQHIKEHYRKFAQKDLQHLIVTGLEKRNDCIIWPRDQNFLGFQNRIYKKGQVLKTIVINSTVFPAALFRDLQFDEQLTYGYEEVDIATRAVCKNYHISMCKEAINLHYPSPVNRDYYASFVSAARLYVTFKRYMFTERQWVKAFAFAVAAPAHDLLHNLRKHGFRGFAKSFRCCILTSKLIVKH